MLYAYQSWTTAVERVQSKGGKLFRDTLKSISINGAASNSGPLACRITIRNYAISHDNDDRSCSGMLELQHAHEVSQVALVVFCSFGPRCFSFQSRVARTAFFLFLRFLSPCCPSWSRSPYLQLSHSQSFAPYLTRPHLSSPVLLLFLLLQLAYSFSLLLLFLPLPLLLLLQLQHCLLFLSRPSQQSSIRKHLGSPFCFALSQFYPSLVCRIPGNNRSRPYWYR